MRDDEKYDGTRLAYTHGMPGGEVMAGSGSLIARPSCRDRQDQHR